MLLEIVWLQEIVQYETSQFIDSTCTSMHGWFIYVIYGSQFVTLSGDQNEVFEYLVLQSLLLTANFMKSNCQKIFFSYWTFDFYGFIIVYNKAFSLWRRQKYHQRVTLNKKTFRNLFCNLQKIPKRCENSFLDYRINYDSIYYSLRWK